MSSQAPEIERRDGQTAIEEVLDHSRFTDRWIAHVLRSLKIGHLTIETPSGARVEGKGEIEGPRATLILHRWRTMRRLMFGGDVGFAEAYMDGDWSTPDLATLIELAALNETALSEVTAGRWFNRVLHRMRHLLRANTKSGSRRNIEAHYDLGNDFYKLWLDPSMTYSSALYADAKQSLEDAQDNKLARIMDLLALNGGERVLEIGCGWGRLAERITTERNAHVTGLTLSPSQLKGARERLAKAGAADKSDLRLQDYRDVTETFDRVVSIEMIEAVGEKYWPAYFGKIAQVLNAGGRAVLQVITIAEERFELYRRNADFIQRYVFPGGMLPSHGVMLEQIKQAGMKFISLENFGESYAHTLNEWNRRFQRAWPEIEAMGYSKKFKRTWEYYLAYCEGGFRSKAIDVGLYVMEKPAN
ncbi:MAG: class I SAM-dependent methyltransferase [Xanthobacteraceae bacterium]|nr:class I SAM-dependent methyltransferase [Xanthobacteraceae bacterium]MCW5679284.1 class I SAM-dependent methyltransferase [Xanthobacteraceae bacterium]